MTRRTALALALLVAATACTRVGEPTPLRVGALYPLSGSQGPGGIDEHRGVLLAAELAGGQPRGVGPIEVVSIDVPAADAAPGAVAALDEAGVDLVVGSYGSTISAVIARATAARGLLFWETGAVGMLPPGVARGELTFRMAPTGAVLGRNAIAFVAERLAGELGRSPSSLRFGVAFVRDAYGRAVARGALAEIRERGLHLVGRFGYDALNTHWRAFARRIERAGVEVLFVSAYLEDGIAMRRAIVREDVPLVASIGTSSSYCMPEFGAALGPDAVGLFASDKPDAGAIDPSALGPDARELLERASRAYRERWGRPMSAAALAGFSAAWALFHEVLPRARSADPLDVAAAARGLELPVGALPNGSGLRFGSPGTPDAGDNLRAASVIWEWVRPGEHVVVWPPLFATAPVRALPP
ncbi:MAG: branched-chain amino acid ABC transporter substrate-binding protein [Actinomycetota bacterium]|nr:MAG: branched-chain amino acid ABC transporter substrate-binding protein [Actinomycetota bacterium]